MGYAHLVQVKNKSMRAYKPNAATLFLLAIAVSATLLWIGCQIHCALTAKQVISCGGAMLKIP